MRGLSFLLFLLTVSCGTPPPNSEIRGKASTAVSRIDEILDALTVAVKKIKPGVKDPVLKVGNDEYVINADTVDSLLKEPIKKMRKDFHRGLLGISNGSKVDPVAAEKQRKLYDNWAQGIAYKVQRMLNVASNKQKEALDVYAKDVEEGLENARPASYIGRNWVVIMDKTEKVKSMLYRKFRGLELGKDVNETEGLARGWLTDSDLKSSPSIPNLGRSTANISRRLIGFDSNLKRMNPSKRHGNRALESNISNNQAKMDELLDKVEEGRNHFYRELTSTLNKINAGTRHDKRNVKHVEKYRKNYDKWASDVKEKVIKVQSNAQKIKQGALAKYEKLEGSPKDELSAKIYAAADQIEKGMQQVLENLDKEFLGLRLGTK